MALYRDCLLYTSTAAVNGVFAFLIAGGLLFTAHGVTPEFLLNLLFYIIIKMCIRDRDSRLQVTSRGYMLGYTDLKDPSVSGFFRFLARVGDGMMKMQIVKIGFGGKQ